jgi:hypothetical protein
MRSKPQVMNLKIAQRTASLTLPVASLEHFPPDALILASFSFGISHAERISCLGDRLRRQLVDQHVHLFRQEETYVPTSTKTEFNVGW